MDREKVTCLEMVNKLAEISKESDQVIEFCRLSTGATNVEPDFVRALSAKREALDNLIGDLLLDLTFRARRETLDEIDARCNKETGGYKLNMVKRELADDSN